MALTVTVDVPARDRELLESWTRSPSVRAGLAERARIVLLAADRVPVTDIVERVGVSRSTVIAWMKRYAAEGIGGLGDRQKSGRPKRIDDTDIVLATLWSRRLNSSASRIGPRVCWPPSSTART